MEPNELIQINITGTKILPKANTGLGNGRPSGLDKVKSSPIAVSTFATLAISGYLLTIRLLPHQK